MLKTTFPVVLSNKYIKMRNKNSFALNENKFKNICQRGKFQEKRNQQKITQKERKSKTIRGIFSLKTFAKISKCKWSFIFKYIL